MQKYATIASFALAAAFIIPTTASAETLNILRGDPTAPVIVPTGGTVVAKSSDQISETAMANPGVADMGMLSSQLLEIVGVSTGRTTLTVLDNDGRVTNFEILVSDGMPEYDENNPYSLPEMPAAEVIAIANGVNSGSISIPSGGAIVVETDVPFTDVRMGDSSIVDGFGLSDTTIYTLGKTEGTATISLVHGGGGPSTVLTIDVMPNMDGME